jgi:hypothetical protein
MFLAISVSALISAVAMAWAWDDGGGEETTADSSPVGPPEKAQTLVSGRFRARQMKWITSGWLLAASGGPSS